MVLVDGPNLLVGEGGRADDLGEGRCAGKQLPCPPDEVVECLAGRRRFLHSRPPVTVLRGGGIVGAEDR